MKEGESARESEHERGKTNHWLTKGNFKISNYVGKKGVFQLPKFFCFFFQTKIQKPGCAKWQS